MTKTANDRLPYFTGRKWVLKKIDGWLSSSTHVPFLISGPAGSGKSTVATHLAAISAGEVPSTTKKLLLGTIVYVHICRAQDDTTLDPLRFIEELATHLANRVPGYAQSLLASTQPELSVVGTASVGHAETGSTVAGVIIQSLQVPNISSRQAFYRLVRRPLDATGTTPPVVLVDGLDEALVYGDGDNLVELIASATNQADESPGPLRWILTSRPDDRVVARIPHRRLDLARDAPPGVDDIQDYVIKRLAQFPKVRAAVAEKVTAAAKGNFLYARYVVNSLISEPDSLANPKTLALPRGLEGHYQEYIERELTRRTEPWEERYRPLLGLLSVALGTGLMRDQLAGAARLAGSRVDDALRTLGQYLTSSSPDGPFQLFHQSFREFLATSDKFKLYPAEAHAALGLYLYKNHAGRWRGCRDDYATLHTDQHLSQARLLGDSLDPDTRDMVRSAVDQLQDDKSYQQSKALERSIADQASRLFGRVEVIGMVDAWLASWSMPILLIVGGAGMGKTTLATKIVHLTRHCQQDARYSTLSSGMFAVFIQLRAQSRTIRPPEILDQIESTLVAKLLSTNDPLQDRPSDRSHYLLRDRTAHILDLLDSSDNDAPILIVFDALDEARYPEEIVSLLSDLTHGRRLRIIATSRPHPDMWGLPTHKFAMLNLDSMSTIDLLEYLHSLGIPGPEAEIIAQRSEGYPLYASLMAEAYKEGAISMADLFPEANNLAELIDREIDRRLARAGEQKRVAQRVLVDLARHPTGLSTVELATSASVSIPVVARILQDIGSLVTQQADGRWRLYHDAVVQVVLSRMEKVD